MKLIPGRLYRPTARIWSVNERSQSHNTLVPEKVYLFVRAGITNSYNSHFFVMPNGKILELQYAIDSDYIKYLNSFMKEQQHGK